MSSHHIVKEKQEPALYIHHFGNFDEEYLGQLLEWNPTVLVNAGEYEKINSLGIKVDILLADEVNFDLQEHVTVLPTQGDVLATAFAYLLDNDFSAVNVIAQHTDLQGLESYVDKINIVVFNHEVKTYCIKSNYSIWKPAGTVFEIGDAENIRTTNLLKINQSQFEVVKDGLVRFEFTRKQIFITEKL